MRSLAMLKDKKDRSGGREREWNLRPATLRFLVYKRRNSGARVCCPQFGGAAMHPERCGYLHGFCLCIPDKVNIRVGGPPVDIVEDLSIFTACVVTLQPIGEVGD